MNFSSLLFVLSLEFPSCESLPFLSHWFRDKWHVRTEIMVAGSPWPLPFRALHRLFLLCGTLFPLLWLTVSHPSTQFKCHIFKEAIGELPVPLRLHLIDPSYEAPIIFCHRAYYFLFIAYISVYIFFSMIVWCLFPPLDCQVCEGIPDPYQLALHWFS